MRKIFQAHNNVLVHVANYINKCHKKQEILETGDIIVFVILQPYGIM